jgi:hypothetical protein
VSVHLDECETTVCLESRLCHVTKVGEQGDEIVLRRVRSQVANVAGGLPGRCLRDDHVVALDAMRGEVVVSVRGSRGHTNGRHGLLLRHRGLALLVCPVATNGPRAKPLAVHGAQRLLRVRAVSEGNEAIATGAASLHVPHDASLGDGAERREGLEEDLIVDLVRQITHKDVEVARGVFLAGRIGLIGPVDSDFLSTQ